MRPFVRRRERRKLFEARAALATRSAPKVRLTSYGPNQSRAAATLSQPIIRLQNRRAVRKEFEGGGVGAVGLEGGEDVFDFVAGEAVEVEVGRVELGQEVIRSPATHGRTVGRRAPCRRRRSGSRRRGRFPCEAGDLERAARPTWQ